MIKLKKLALIALSTATVITVPAATVISCGSKIEPTSDGANIVNEKAKINFSYDPNELKVNASKQLLDYFYEDKTVQNENEGVDILVYASDGKQINVSLSAEEWKEVVSANKIDHDVVDDIAPAEFANALDAWSQGKYYFSEAVGEKLGLIPSTNKYDENFTKQWLIDNLIHRLPSNLNITKLAPKQTTTSYSMAVTFSDGKTSADLNLGFYEVETDNKATQINGGGINPFAVIFDSIEDPLKSVFGSLEELFKIVKTKKPDYDVKSLAKSFLRDATTNIIVRYPIVKQALTLQFVGLKEFTNKNLLTPITEAVINSIV